MKEIEFLIYRGFVSSGPPRRVQLQGRIRCARGLVRKNLREEVGREPGQAGRAFLMVQVWPLYMRSERKESWVWKFLHLSTVLRKFCQASGESLNLDCLSESSMCLRNGPATFSHWLGSEDQIRDQWLRF